MKYKTLFRMLLKVLGVWVFVEGLFGLVNMGLSGYVTSLYQAIPPLRFSEQWWISVEPLAAPLVQIVIGLYLFSGGAWVANRAFPGNRPYCGECGCDLTGSGERCPECGAVVPQFQNRLAAHESNDLKSEI